MMIDYVTLWLKLEPTLQVYSILLILFHQRTIFKMLVLNSRQKSVPFSARGGGGSPTTPNPWLQDWINDKWTTWGYVADFFWNSGVWNRGVCNSNLCPGYATYTNVAMINTRYTAVKYDHACFILLTAGDTEHIDFSMSQITTVFL